MNREELTRHARKNEPVERADLREIDLSGLVVEKLVLRRCDLYGANLENAKLRGAELRQTTLSEAFLSGADLSEANLENVDLEGANLINATLTGANLTRANLEGADLTGANLVGARLLYAQLDSAKLGKADLTGAILRHVAGHRSYFGKAKLKDADLRNAELREANLEESDLENVDARHADLTGARLDGAILTGARLANVIGTGAPVTGVQVVWVDTSVRGDGTARMSNGEIPALLSGLEPTKTDDLRYLGSGDAIRDAILDFAPGVRVQLDGLLERCTIHIGDGAELVVGETGVLADCKVEGAGRIIVHGKFYERESPGIVGPRELVVTGRGVLVAAVQQTSEPSRFGFEEGSRLRIKIKTASGGAK